MTDEPTSKPRRAPRKFARMRPVVVMREGLDEEWAGSGVPIAKHPIGTSGGDECRACHGTHTVVIWARSSVNTGGLASWGAVIRDVSYELYCLDCKRFSLYDFTI